MAETTVEIDTTQEEAPSPNGHDTTWQSFDNDAALLEHIISKKPAEELVEVPEWNVKILCKALYAEARIEVDAQAYNAETKRTNYAPYASLIVIRGCYNPSTGNLVFSDAHEKTLKDPRNGSAVVRLAFTILRLSGMLVNDVNRAKKN